MKKFLIFWKLLFITIYNSIKEFPINKFYYPTIKYIFKYWIKKNSQSNTYYHIKIYKLDTFFIKIFTFRKKILIWIESCLYLQNWLPLLFSDYYSKIGNIQVNLWNNFLNFLNKRQLQIYHLHFLFFRERAFDFLFQFPQILNFHSLLSRTE